MVNSFVSRNSFVGRDLSNENQQSKENVHLIPDPTVDGSHLVRFFTVGIEIIQCGDNVKHILTHDQINISVNVILQRYWPQSRRPEFQ